MIDKIVNACTRALYGEFGEDYTYYVDLPDQNFSTPSFTADVVNPMMERKHPFTYAVEIDDTLNFKRGMLYRRVMPVVLHYFPEDKKGKHECFRVAERLFEAMEEIEFEGQAIRGYNMEMQVTDNVLQFFVTYAFFTMTSLDDADGFETVYTGVTTSN